MRSGYVGRTVCQSVLHVVSERYVIYIAQNTTPIELNTILVSAPDERCDLTDWDLLSGEPLVPEQWPTMPAITTIAWRTDIIAIVYFAISCAWLLGSLGLLCEYYYYTQHIYL